MSEQRAAYHAPSGRGGNHSDDHSHLVKACQQYIGWQGGWCLKVLGGVGQAPGVADLLACLPLPGQRFGVLVAVEVKTGKGVLSNAQKRQRDDMIRAGALFVECRSIEALEDALVAAGLASPVIQRGGRQGR